MRDTTNTSARRVFRGEDRHRIAVGVEAEAALDRRPVGGERALPAVEGGDEDEERRPGQVEVRDEPRGVAEAMAGEDRSRTETFIRVRRKQGMA